MRYLGIVAAIAVCLAVTSTASMAITVTPGADALATVYAGVRYRDFGQNNSEWDIGLYDYRVNTTVPRVNKTYYRGTTVEGTTPYGSWQATNSIEFGYVPNASGDDAIYTKVTSSHNYRLDWTLPDPANPINYLQIDVRDINVAGQPDDYVQFVLTDINGDPLSGSQYTFTADNAYLTWNLTDPTIFEDGFILKGTLNLTGYLTNANGEKNELLDLKFGNTPSVGKDAIPEPVTMAGLMMGIGGLVTYIRKRRTA